MIATLTNELKLLSCCITKGHGKTNASHSQFEIDNYSDAPYSDVPLRGGIYLTFTIRLLFISSAWNS